MSEHPYIEKYNPDNYHPKIYNFLDDFSDIELSDIRQITLNDESNNIEASLNFLAQKVHDKYRFKKIKYGDSALDPQAIKTGEVDCYGYTVALSQALEHANIDHNIAFANTHAFIIATKPNIASESSGYYLLDALSPKISGNIDEAVVCHKDCIQKNYFGINMKQHLINTGNCDDVEQYLNNHPWTHFKSTRLLSAKNFEHSKNQNIYVKLFSPDEGANILYANDELRHSMSKNDISRAYMLSKFVTQNYPEIDIRNKPLTLQNLIKRLGMLGLTNLASNTIERTASARSINGTIAHDIWRSDEYKKLAQLTGKLEYLEISHNILDTTIKDRGDSLSLSANKLIGSKLNKLRAIFSKA